MDILNQIIGLMNKEEVRHFKLFTARTNIKGPRKDLIFFDYIRKVGDDFDEPYILSKLYPKKSKNPYYRLKNRLLSDINKSLNLQHMDDDDTVHVFHLLSLARFFHNRSKYKIAFHYIRKAEKKAIKLDNYELLDFIYSELIKLSHEIIFINPEEYIQKRKENRKKLAALREIDDVLAAVIYRVKVSQNLASDKNPIFDLLEKTVDEFTQNPAVKSDPKLRFTLYHAVSRILLAKKEFHALESYLLATYQEFEGEGLFTKATHDTKLQMLVYLINTLRRNKKIQLSLQYTATLKEALAEYNGMLHKKYLYYYYNALVINYSILDNNKAVEILEGVIGQKTFHETPFNEFLMVINLAVCYFNLKKFRRSIKSLVQACLHDGYHVAGEMFQLKIAIFELTLRLESGDFDILARRVDEIRKDYREILESNEQGLENLLIQLISEMNEVVDVHADSAMVKKIGRFLDQQSREALEDFSFINYHDWLSGKIGRRVTA